MTSGRRTLLALGVGNVLLRDEGVGVRVARDLAALDAGALPEGTTVVDGGTLGLDLLPMIEDAAGVVLVDAVDLGSAPGSMRVIRDDELNALLALHVPPHQVGVGDLLAAARLAGSLPGRVSLVAIQPRAIDVGLELTSEVEAAVPAAVELVRDELASMAAELAAGAAAAHEAGAAAGRQAGERDAGGEPPATGAGTAGRR